MLVTGSNGVQVPLGQVAEIRQVSGPAMINSENGLLEVSVLLNARGRDPGSVIAETVRKPGWQCIAVEFVTQAARNLDVVRQTLEQAVGTSLP